MREKAIVWRQDNHCGLADGQFATLTDHRSRFRYDPLEHLLLILFLIFPMHLNLHPDLILNIISYKYTSRNRHLKVTSLAPKGRNRNARIVKRLDNLVMVKIRVSAEKIYPKR